MGRFFSCLSAVFDTIAGCELPTSFRALSVDTRTLSDLLDTAGRGRAATTRISLPHPKGGFEVFDFYPSNIMSAELARKYPQVRAFKGRSVDDPHVTATLELTPRGVTAQVLPLLNGGCLTRSSRVDLTWCGVFAKNGNVVGREHKCLFETAPPVKPDSPQSALTARSAERSAARAVGQSLRTYRIAVAATGEYSTYHGGTKAGALSAITTTMNRVTGIFEREIAVSFTLVDIDDIIFLNASTDGLTNNDAGALIDESQSVIDSVIGTGNYDIGHTFSTGAGGLAGRGPCRAKQSPWRQAVCPIGDAYDVDYVAHEIGHQFDGNHTFNGVTGSCSGSNRSASTAYEPGSASTILGYAGICGSDLEQTVMIFFL